MNAAQATHRIMVLHNERDDLRRTLDAIPACEAAMPSSAWAEKRARTASALQNVENELSTLGFSK